MEGLFVVIAIIIGIYDFAVKQQKRQGGGRQHSQRRQAPVQKRRDIPEPFKRAIMDMEKAWNEGLNGPVAEEPASASVYEEGLEQEERIRTGSLEYIEQDRSPEGVCDEHSFHRPQEDRAVERTKADEPAESREGFVFDLNEEELLKSIVMAEVLGPPRAMKRRIR
ncbi:MAG TPA: hypothetical protein VN580_03700 [Clostridia bacterium]|nr:hypothetical protein [Clostridia bacterium]